MSAILFFRMAQQTYWVRNC